MIYLFFCDDKHICVLDKVTYISVASDKLAERCDLTLEEGKYVFIYVSRKMSFNKLKENFMSFS